MAYLRGPEALLPESLPLAGRHLIEASAGTGKTFNITRIYLRLLLEKKLTVQQILVMTFTRAATEELRGRIAQTIRDSLNGWGKLGENDSFYARLEAQFDPSEARTILEPALLELDEASIFTIHGFCNRVLSQQAFASGLPFEVEMEADTKRLQIEVVRDWLRQVCYDDSSFTLLADKGWHEPEVFYDTFRTVLTSDIELEFPKLQQNEVELQEEFEALTSMQIETYQNVCSHQDQILAGLLDSKRELESLWPEMLKGIGKVGGSFPQSLVSKFSTYSNYENKAKEFKSSLAQLKSLNAAHKSWFNNQTQYQNVIRSRLVVGGILYIRQRIAHSKQKQAVLDYDDLIQHLYLTLVQNPEGALSRQLRAEFPVALVDEFQDTDHKQYCILDTLYPASDKGSLLLMIGDPKQAIYGFRGGDIFTYLKARKDAQFHWHMDTNWRSVEAMVTAYNRLFWGNSLEAGAADIFRFGIAYDQIQSTAHAKSAATPLLDAEEGRSALNYLWLPKEDALNASSDGYMEQLADWCAHETCRLLEQSKLGEEEVVSGDIAFLVRSGREAEFVRCSLKKLGLDSVFVSNRTNLFDAEEAHELLLALTGIWNCESSKELIRALSTRLLGYSAESLAKLQDEDNETDFEAARDLTRSLRQMWQQKGVMALMIHLMQHRYLPPRDTSERAMTNMLHLAEVLQARARQFKHPQQILKWFAEQCHMPGGEQEYIQRLESDSQLVRIVTQHGSKGLEYPIVFIPFASKYQDPAKAGIRFKEVYTYQDQQKGSAVCQIGQSDDAKKSVKSEGHAESVRLLYVAVTRAAHRCYLGVAPFTNSHQSALGVALQVKKATEWEVPLQTICAESHKTASYLTVRQLPEHSNAQRAQVNRGELLTNKLDRILPESWRLSSFSGLTKNSLSLRQDKKERSDETEPEQLIGEENDAEQIRFQIAKGAATGNLLHDTLEHTDFTKPNWELATEAPLVRFGLLLRHQVVELYEWLQSCLDTTLPSLYPDEHGPFCLAELSWAQTLRESEFYYPMAELRRSALEQILATHRAEEEARLPCDRELKGMMHGFIDLVFEYQGRYYVADYKSTHLGNRFTDYAHDALEQNNRHHYYDLQYLLYMLALHRYLRYRIHDYEPKKHLGGVYYLYLRGMSQSNQKPFGVYARKIKSELLEQLDGLFSQDGRRV